MREQRIFPLSSVVKNLDDMKEASWVEPESMPFSGEHWFVDFDTRTGVAYTWNCPWGHPAYLSEEEVLSPDEFAEEEPTVVEKVTTKQLLEEWKRR